MGDAALKVMDVIGVVFLVTATIYSWASLLNKKVNLKNYKFYICLIIFSIALIINYDNVNVMIKYAITTIIISVFVKLLFNVSFKQSFMTAVFTQVLGIFIELVYSILAVAIFDFEFRSTLYPKLMVFFADIFVGIFYVLLTKTRPIKKLYSVIIKVTEKISTKIILFCCIPLIFIFNIYLTITNFNSLHFAIANNVSLIIIIAIVLILVKKEYTYTKIYDKYNTTLNSLKEYEEILDKYRISSHENKNQLLTIRSMLVGKNKKVSDYIDQIVQNKLKDDDKIVHEVSIIPAGGLRGLIYSKLLYMKQNNIEYELNISKEIKTVDLIDNFDDSDILDVCQVIGVYIDNAIDEVLSIKNKHLSINMYLDGKELVFEISNYYKNKIEIDRLEEKGYTTKGSGHGYGLSLTKDIIDNNKKLRNEKKLTKETFTQVLKIKM